jgi:hypothetical protein
MSNSVLKYVDDKKRMYFIVNNKRGEFVSGGIGQSSVIQIDMPNVRFAFDDAQYSHHIVKT